MPAAPTAPRQAEAPKLRSVLAKITLIAAVAGFGYALALGLLVIRASLVQVHRAVTEVAATSAPTLARQIAEPLMYAKIAQVEGDFAKLEESARGKNIGALAINAQGNVKAQRIAEGEGGADVAALTALAQRALADQALVASEDGLMQAAPAVPYDGAAPVGAVATAWSVAPDAAALWRDLRAQIAGIAAVFAGLLVVMAWATNRMVARPLREVDAAMRQIAAEDYATAVPHLGRGDEIGAIARSLGAFRDGLAASQEVNRIALMRGAALDAGTAASMITDDAFTITAVNPAMVELFRRLAPVIRHDNPGFDPECLIGTSALGILVDKANRTEENHLSEGGHWRIEHELGEIALRIDVAPVRDAEGTKIGHVAQWSDITERRHDGAILGAIDHSQMRAECALDGRLTAANERFIAQTGARIGQDLGAALTLRDDEGGPALARAADGHEIVGRFDLCLGDRRHVLEGTLAPVTNARGAVVQYLLLGSDVTEAVETLGAAEAARAADQAKQQRVVEALRDSLARLSDGDLACTLTAPFPPEYETLRHDFNAATDKLNEAMRTVLENAEAIRGESHGLSRAGDELSQRTERQAATLEQTAAALNQLTTSVQSAAEGARHANTMVASAKLNAESSGKVVREAVQAMDEIAESSAKISKITSVIEEIAFQTNLLALNAGVEAARAGEAGRGFAVVASEVRALAQRSSEAAREIAGLISSSEGQVKRGVALVGQAGDALGGIQSSVGEIFTSISDIAASTAEQSAGLSEINTAVMQLDQATQQNAGISAEAASSSQALIVEADALNATMARFRLDTDARGEAAQRRTCDPAPAPRAAPVRTTTPAAPAAPATPPSTMSSFRSTRSAAAASAPRVPLPGHRLSALAVKPVEEDDWEDF
ncbi:MAG: methyl-accepting chemotaxis protein [Paenirhodobacter sp.]|uniref:methyl-accepting chemotaxis protein n=1 Tax=Paenirhodobacter sp. TaxID=1965326 RepID=UPI003D0F3A82